MEWKRIRGQKVAFNAIQFNVQSWPREKLDFSENPVLRSPGRRVCGRPELARKKKKKGVQRGTFGTSFCRLTLNLLSPFFFWFLVLMWVSYKLFLLAKNKRLRKEKIKSKGECCFRFQTQARQPRRKRREEARELCFSRDSNVQRRSLVRILIF